MIDLENRTRKISCSLASSCTFSAILLIIFYLIYCYFHEIICSAFYDAIKTNPPWILITTLITAPVVIFLWYQRFKHKEEDLDLERKRQIAERFSRATNMLASKSRVVRAGGVCEMEFISRHSKSHHGEVLDVIAIFIREISPWNGNENQEQIAKTPEDIQAALRFLGRREHTYTEYGFINLEKTDLRKACFDKETNLEGTCFSEAHLENANFSNVNLKMKTDIIGDKYKTNFNNAHLEGANFVGAILSHAIFANARLEGANFTDANLDGVDMEGASYDNNTTIPDEYSVFKETMEKVNNNQPTS